MPLGNLERNIPKNPLPLFIPKAHMVKDNIKSGASVFMVFIFNIHMIRDIFCSGITFFICLYIFL